MWVLEQYPPTGLPAFACFRPAVLPPRALPASLVSPAFGAFLDTAALPLSALQAFPDVSRCAMQLLEAMPLSYDSEAERQAAVNATLSHFLGSPVRSLGVGPLSKTSRPATDGSLTLKLGANEVTIMTVEVKSEPGASGDPLFQLVAFSQQQASDERRTFGPTLPCAHPKLLVEVVGPLLRVSAFASLRPLAALCEPLTPFLHVVPVTNQPAYIARLIAALRALREAVTALQSEYTAASSQSPAPAAVGPELPYPLRSAAYSDVLHAGGGRLLWSATTERVAAGGGGGADQPPAPFPAGVRVLVKFAPHYGKNVHEAWAAAGLAPALHLTAKLPGGLTQVVMERLPCGGGGGWATLLERPEARTDAVAALAAAHAVPLPQGGRGAHGDCRPGNVLVRARGGGGAGFDVRFVDFDWAGRRRGDVPAAHEPRRGLARGRRVRRRADPGARHGPPARGAGPSVQRGRAGGGRLTPADGERERRSCHGGGRQRGNHRPPAVPRVRRRAGVQPGGRAAAGERGAPRLSQPCLPQPRWRLAFAWAPARRRLAHAAAAADGQRRERMARGEGRGGRGRALAQRPRHPQPGTGDEELGTRRPLGRSHTRGRPRRA